MNLKTPNFKLEFWNSRLKDLINSYLSKLKVFELQGMRLSDLVVLCIEYYTRIK